MAKRKLVRAFYADDEDSEGEYAIEKINGEDVDINLQERYRKRPRRGTWAQQEEKPYGVNIPPVESVMPARFNSAVHPNENKYDQKGSKFFFEFPPEIRQHIYRAVWSGQSCVRLGPSWCPDSLAAVFDRAEGDNSDNHDKSPIDENRRFKDATNLVCLCRKMRDEMLAELNACYFSYVLNINISLVEHNEIQTKPLLNSGPPAPKFRNKPNWSVSFLTTANALVYPDFPILLKHNAAPAIADGKQGRLHHWKYAFIFDHEQFLDLLARDLQGNTSIRKLVIKLAIRIPKTEQQRRWGAGYYSTVDASLKKFLPLMTALEGLETLEIWRPSFEGCNVSSTLLSDAFTEDLTREIEYVAGTTWIMHHLYPSTEPVVMEGNNWVGREQNNWKYKHTGVRHIFKKGELKPRFVEEEEIEGAVVY
ncbi:hypothetical protein BDV96DRAFT_251508 [Lophiotrema nucula]|uniref:Uncharacterized protein n=1 Tax=Lophiotrema nucula TaxID=690887 RepID=A0A6A5YPQ2_9PLEO|nr:hypothetical protein BDV96DRAFT_251508 [Lophiotrema nucula]